MSMRDVRIKRVYEKPEPEDGLRILVDRLWPRGLKKEDARIDHWMKQIAPSDELRKWFAHEAQRWPQFKKRYLQELRDKKNVLEDLKILGRTNERITFLFGAKNPEQNNAVVLCEALANMK